MAGEFLDTNIIVYAFTADPRAGPAQTLLGRGCVASVQALNEFANVARRKLGLTWREVREALAAIRVLCQPILPVDLETHTDALRVAERYGYAIFDALMIAAALRARCTVLYPEDIQDGTAIGRRLRIVDPFVGVRLGVHRRGVSCLSARLSCRDPAKLHGRQRTAFAQLILPCQPKPT